MGLRGINLIPSNAQDLIAHRPQDIPHANVEYAGLPGISAVITLSVNHDGAYGFLNNPAAKRTLPKSYFEVRTRLSYSRQRGTDLLVRWIVVQVRSKPSFYLGKAHVFAPAIVLHLIAANLAYGEIARLRMREIEAANTGAGPHRV